MINAIIKFFTTKLFFGKLFQFIENLDLSNKNELRRLKKKKKKNSKK